MDISRESFLKADDPKVRDSMLYDMLLDIKNKVDYGIKMEDRLNRCEGSIMVIKSIGCAFFAIYTSFAAWLGLK